MIENKIARSLEVGSSKLIKETAMKLGVEYDDSYLESQFRCMGSNDYLLWIESTLGYSTEKRILRKNEIFEFKVFDSPEEMYEILQKKEQKRKILRELLQDSVGHGRRNWM